MIMLVALLRRRAASKASGWLFFGNRKLNLDAVTKEQPPRAFGTSSPSQEGSFKHSS